MLAFFLFMARNAMAIALFLSTHRGVTKVLYPGLTSHPQHELAKKQQHGFGAMITFYCVGDRKQSALFLKSVCLFIYLYDFCIRKILSILCTDSCFVMIVYITIYCDE